MIHMRLVVPDDLKDQVLDLLCGSEAVSSVICIEGAAHKPEGDVILADIAREDASVIVSDLKELDLDHRGTIALEYVDTAISDAAEAAEKAAHGAPADAVVWEQVESHTSEETELSFSFLAFMVIAMLIAGVGVITDSTILIIGAMIVGPEFGPLTATAVGAYRHQRFWRSAVAVLGAGIAAAVTAAAVVGAGARIAGEPGDSFEPASRFFTSFVTEPNAYSAVVALVAGVAGTISLARTQATALAGVLVSVTTIPAAAAIGTDAAAGNWSDLRGASVQLAINLSALLIAVLATLAVYDRAWARSTPEGRRPFLP